MLIEADLRGANLDGAHMTGCVLTMAKLRRATLSEVDLTAATLRWSDLSGADLTGAVLCQANLNEVQARKSVLRSADLGYATVVGGSLVGADLSRALVYGASVWDVDLTHARQEHLVITRPSEPEGSVDDLNVAQFLHLIISNSNIRSVVDTLATKVVLVLGRFTPARKAVLEVVRAALRRRGFVPVCSTLNDRPAATSPRPSSRWRICHDSSSQTLPSQRVFPRNLRQLFPG
jgi:Pentapeptide repeats (8 copies)